MPLKPGSPFSPFSPWRPGLPKERKTTWVYMQDIWCKFHINFLLQFLFYLSINTCLEILPCQGILWDLGHPAFQEFLHYPFHPYLQINLDYPFFLVLPRRSSTHYKIHTLILKQLFPFAMLGVTPLIHHTYKEFHSFSI